MSTTDENKNKYNSDSTVDPVEDWGISDGSVNQAIQSYLRDLGKIPRLTTEEREALTLDDVRTFFYPRTDAEIAEYISKNARPDNILDNVKWIEF